MSKNGMIMLPREVVEHTLDTLNTVEWSVVESRWIVDGERIDSAINTLRAALEQPQPDPAPYLYYDPENGDTWTQEAINDGCCPPDGLIALYTN